MSGIYLSLIRDYLIDERCISTFKKNFLKVEII
jgi:hypothetical protein